MILKILFYGLCFGNQRVTSSNGANPTEEIDKLNDKDDTEINGVLVRSRATCLAIAKKLPNPLMSLRTRVRRTLTDSLKGSLCKPLNPSDAAIPDQFRENSIVKYTARPALS